MAQPCWPVDSFRATARFLAAACAHDNEAVHSIHYNIELAASTYQKLCVRANGDTLVRTNAPVELLLGTCEWRHYEFTVCTYRPLYVAYDKTATAHNAFWQSCKAMHRKMPQLCGDVVFFTCNDDLTWDASQCLEQVARYVANHKQYNFSF